MKDELSPKYREYKDDWGTTAREGYEDRGPVRPRRSAEKQRGSSILRTLGGIAIVGGILWGVYLVTRGGDVASVLRENHGPVALIALGAIASVLGKYVRI